MAMTHEELDQFHRFATERLQTVETDVTFDDLVSQWRDERSTTNEALAVAFEELDAGLQKPLAEAMEEIRQRLDLQIP